MTLKLPDVSASSLPGFHTRPSLIGKEFALHAKLTFVTFWCDEVELDSERKLLGIGSKENTFPPSPTAFAIANVIRPMFAPTSIPTPPSGKVLEINLNSRRSKDRK
jgi:hypothetical protein